MNDEAPALASSFTRAETEAGRKLFAGDWQFAWAEIAQATADSRSSNGSANGKG